ncbi:MAG: hypothetical protein WD059_06545 [Balneolaceae bacterium]
MTSRTFKHKQSIFLNLILLIIPCLFLSCDTTGTDDPDVVGEYEFDFRESDHDWEPFFTDYNVGRGDDMELTADYRTLPEPLDAEGSGHFLSAVNHSDDVKMLLRKEVEGLEPNTNYHVQFSVQFATNVPSGCAGIGGAPGESVMIIADASEIMPEPFIEEENEDYYRLNVQHRGGPQSWYQNAIMGDIANSQECEDDPEYEFKELNSEEDHDQVTTDEEGRVWLLIGTRSGFEGQTDLYFTYFSADFRELESPEPEDED